MKINWKWILIILLVVILITAVIAVPYAMHTYMASTFAGNAAAPGSNWQHPAVPGFNGRFGGHMFGGEHMFSGGRNFGGGMTPFMFGFGILGGLFRLIPLALIALLGYGIFQLGKRSGQKSTAVSQQYPPAIPVAPVQAATAKEQTTPADTSTPPAE